MVWSEEGEVSVSHCGVPAADACFCCSCTSAVFIGPAGRLIKTRDSRRQMSLSYKQNNKELYVVVTALGSAVCILCDAAGAESFSSAVSP